MKMHLDATLMSLIMKPRGGYVSIYIYVYVYVMDLYLMVMLRSTTGPYGRLVIEVAYGEMIFSLHRCCMRHDSLGRVVGVSV